MRWNKSTNSMKHPVSNPLFYTSTSTHTHKHQHKHSNWRVVKCVSLDDKGLTTSKFKERTQVKAQTHLQFCLRETARDTTTTREVMQGTPWHRKERTNRHNRQKGCRMQVHFKTDLKRVLPNAKTLSSSSTSVPRVIGKNT